MADGWKNGRPVVVELYSIGKGFFLHKPAALDFLKMAKAIKADTVIDITTIIDRAFATMAQQRRLYNLYMIDRGNKAARPGWSNHQAGTAVDINRGKYDNTPDGKANGLLDVWFDEHLKEYNFVRDVVQEPWHLHWIGEPQPAPYAGKAPL